MRRILELAANMLKNTIQLIDKSKEMVTSMQPNKLSPGFKTSDAGSITVADCLRNKYLYELLETQKMLAYLQVHSYFSFSRQYLNELLLL